MTLIAAMGCKKGIILAADGQNTLTHKIDDFNVYTRSTTRKIQKFGKNKLWAAAGSEGGIIEFGKRIDALSDDVKKKPLTDPKSDLYQSLNDIAVGIRDRDPKNPLYYVVVGPQEIWYWKNKTKKWRDKTSYDLAPYAGDYFANRCKIVWVGDTGVTLPAQIITNRYIECLHTLEQGVLAVYAAMKEAISLLAFGVGTPIDVRAIRNDGVIVPFDQDKLEKCYSDLTARECLLFAEIVQRCFD